MSKINFHQIFLFAMMLATATFAGGWCHGQSVDQKSETEQTQSQKTVAKKSGSHDRFLRVRVDRKGRPVAMETSIVRYQKMDADGQLITVDLIGAVHVGEGQYYKDLNKQFEKYDALLYELVAPEGTVVPKGGRDKGKALGNPIGAMQVGMQSVLELKFQLDLIDYTKKNFVHADMSPTEFAQSMKKNEESVAGYALKAIGSSMAMQQAGKDTGSAGMLMAMFSKNKALRLRRVMAKQMIDMDAGLAMFKGKDGSTIVNHRNAKCMKILSREIAAGKKDLGIFYGAAHLADMEKRLINDFDMQPGGQKWIPAWKLTKREFVK